MRISLSTSPTLTACIQRCLSNSPDSLHLLLILLPRETALQMIVSESQAEPTDHDFPFSTPSLASKTLYLLAHAQHTKVLFVEDVVHFRALGTALRHLLGQDRSRVRDITVYGILDLHRRRPRSLDSDRNNEAEHPAAPIQDHDSLDSQPGKEWNAQSLSHSLASLVDGILTSLPDLHNLHFVERRIRTEAAQGNTTSISPWDDDIPLFNETFRSRISVPTAIASENSSRVLQMPVMRLFQKYGATKNDAFG